MRARSLSARHRRDDNGGSSFQTSHISSIRGTLKWIDVENGLYNWASFIHIIITKTNSKV